MSLITPDFGLLFWMTLIFAIVFFILAKFGFPMITGMVDQRADRIDASIRRAKEAEQQLGGMVSQQQKMMEEVRAEQSRILKEASQTRDAIVTQAREQAQIEAGKVLDQARAQIASEKEAAIREISSRVALMSVDVAEKILRTTLSDDKSQKELVDRLVDELSRTENRS